MLYISPESLTGGQEIQGNVLYGVLPEESCCRYIQLFIGKYADLFTTKGATLNMGCCCSKKMGFKSLACRGILSLRMGKNGN